jgi:hypothetical protein
MVLAFSYPMYIKSFHSLTIPFVIRPDTYVISPKRASPDIISSIQNVIDYVRIVLQLHML